MILCFSSIDPGIEIKRPDAIRDNYVWCSWYNVYIILITMPSKIRLRVALSRQYNWNKIVADQWWYKFVINRISLMKYNLVSLKYIQVVMMIIGVTDGN